MLPLDSPPKPTEPALHLRYNVGCKRWPPVLSGLLSISSEGVLGTALIIGEPDWRSFLQITNLCKSFSMMLLFTMDFGDLCSGDNEELLWLLWKAFPICKLTMSNKDWRRCLPPILSFLRFNFVCGKNIQRQTRTQKCKKMFLLVLKRKHTFACFLLFDRILSRKV